MALHLCLLVIPSAIAQGPRQDPRGPGPGAASHFRFFDPANQETVRGEILRVNKVASRRGWGYGVRRNLFNRLALVVQAGQALKRCSARNPLHP